MSGLSEIQVRKLEQTEHIRTRSLWEEVFTEDSAAFLNYYYEEKCRDNTIYVVESQGEILSMLHLNPYEVRVKDRIRTLHYIVAVATKIECRGRGYMRMLLNAACEEMKEAKESFTFLMPAAEAIYKPFGFHYFATQACGRVKGTSAGAWEWSYLQEDGCEEVAAYVNEKLQKYEVTIWRDGAFYRRMLKEQKSEQGGILLARKEGRLMGVFPFAKEEHWEMREPICEPEVGLSEAAFYLAGEREVHCIGEGEERKPMFMGKILDVDEMKADFGMADFPKNIKIFINEVV